MPARTYGTARGKKCWMSRKHLTMWLSVAGWNRGGRRPRKPRTKGNAFFIKACFEAPINVAVFFFNFQKLFLQFPLQGTKESHFLQSHLWHVSLFDTLHCSRQKRKLQIMRPLQMVAWWIQMNCLRLNSSLGISGLVCSQLAGKHLGFRLFLQYQGCSLKNGN